MSQVVILKLPSGSSAPQGYTFVRSTRSGDIYHKKLNLVSQADINELSDIFGKFGVENVAVIPSDTEATFLNAFAGLSMGGKKGRRTKKSKKSKKSKKTKKRKNIN